MDDLISRQAAIDAIQNSHDAIQNSHEMSDYYWSKGMEHAMEIIRSLPSADRPKGHIVTKCSGKFNPTVWAECSECEKPIDAWDKFCKHCGAKMEE